MQSIVRSNLAIESRNRVMLSSLAIKSGSPDESFKPLVNLLVLLFFAKLCTSWRIHIHEQTAMDTFTG